MAWDTASGERANGFILELHTFSHSKINQVSLEEIGAVSVAANKTVIKSKQRHEPPRH